MDDTELRILKAASRLHGERGFRGTTTRAIAEAAGVNEVTLFRHFASKKDLLLAAARLRAAQSIERMRTRPLPEHPRDIAAELTPWLTASLHAFLAAQGPTRTSLGEFGHNPDIDIEHMRDANFVYERVRRYLGAAREAGLIRDDLDLDVAVELVVGSVFADGLLRGPMPHRFPLPPDESVRHYLDVLLGGMLPHQHGKDTA